MNTSAHLGDDILNAWIDNVATDQERAVVRDHIATCDICTQRVNELRAVKAMLASLPKIAPPRSFQLTADQAKNPIPIKTNESTPGILRLLPILRTLSVAAILAVLVLGGVLVFGPSDDFLTTQDDIAMEADETDPPPLSFQMQEQPPAAMDPGEVIDQGESASAHDSTSGALAREAQESTMSSSDPDDGLSALEITTIALGVLAIVFSVTWMWISMSIRNGASR